MALEFVPPTPEDAQRLINLKLGVASARMQGSMFKRIYFSSVSLLIKDSLGRQMLEGGLFVHMYF